MIRLLSGAVCAVTLLSGCAGMNFPSKVTIAATAPSAPMRLVDERPQAERISRVDDSTGLTRYLGDSDIQPSLVGLVNDVVVRATPPRLRDQPVRLTKLEADFWHAPASNLGSRSRTPITIIQGAPAGAVVVGNLLGYGLLHLMGSKPGGSSRTQMARVYITVQIGSESVTGWHSDAIEQRTAEETMSFVAKRALEELEKNIAALEKEPKPVEYRPLLEPGEAEAAAKR